MQNSQHWDFRKIQVNCPIDYQKNHCRTVSIETFTCTSLFTSFQIRKTIAEQSALRLLYIKFILSFINQKNHCRTVSIETLADLPPTHSLLNQKNHCRTVSIETILPLLWSGFGYGSEKPLQNSQHWDSYLSSEAIAIEYQKNHCRTVSIETLMNNTVSARPISEKPLQNSQHWDI